MNPEGQNVVVTGAAGGIGSALVHELIRRGAQTVIATDLRVGELNALYDGTPGVLTRGLDVTDEAATHALVEEVEDRIGPIGVFFANAGIATGAELDTSDDVWLHQWSVNVMPHVYAARALIPRWVERSNGHLVVTASMAGLLSSLRDAAYAATKHAAVGAAEWLAIRYADDGVRISCICPGAVDTAMLRRGGGGGGDAAKAAAAIGGGAVLGSDDAAIRILDQLAEGRFLIMTHPEMQEFVVAKATDPDRWIRGMVRLSRRAPVD